MSVRSIIPRFGRAARKILKVGLLLPLSYTLFGQTIIAFLVVAHVRRTTPSLLRNPEASFKFLVLSSERFPPGELEALRDSGGFEFLFLPKPTVHMLINLRWDHRVKLDKTLRVGDETLNPELLRENKARLKKFYQGILKIVFKRLDVSAVLGAAPHYRQDHDLGLAAKSMGIPYFVIYKECLITNRKHHERIVTLYSKIEPKSISHIFVHNQTSKSAVIESGVVGADDVSALGNVRMDSYLKRLSGYNKDFEVLSVRRKKRAILFSFLQGVGLYGWTLMKPKSGGPGYFRLFDEVHQTFALLARDQPEVEFVIKTKWGSNWFDEVDRSLEEAGIDRTELHNLTITSDVSAHELIHSADVVVAFGSTTILEAGIAGKPVVIPDFAEAAEEEYSSYIQLRVAYDAFDLASDAGDLRGKILRHLYEPYRPDPVIAQKREEYFAAFISNPEGSAVQRYKTVFEKLLS